MDINKKPWLKIYCIALYRPVSSKMHDASAELAKVKADLDSIANGIREVGCLKCGKSLTYLNVSAIDGEKHTSVDEMAYMLRARPLKKLFEVDIRKVEYYGGAHLFVLRPYALDGGTKEYGYSPSCFSKDKAMLSELDKELSEYFGNGAISDMMGAASCLGEGGEQLAASKFGNNMIVVYRMADRLELTKKEPELANECFSDLEMLGGF